MKPSTAQALVIVDELAAAGVTDVVLCPGSRNAPLSLALVEAERAGRIRLHVRIDERTAGFLALGLGKATGRPAAVVTTSGTAVANLHPAVLEAHHGKVPLVVVSANRPPRLQDVGANQVIDQRAVFGSALRFLHSFEVAQERAGQQAGWRAMVDRAVAYSLGVAGVPGPVQLDIPFAEPLVPDGSVEWPESLESVDGPWTRIALPARDVAVPDPEPGERVLYLAALTDPRGAELAAAGHVVVSEAGGAAGSQVLAAGMHLLAAPRFLARHRPDRVVVLGRPTLFRQVNRLLADPLVVIDVADDPVGYADIAGRARHVAPMAKVTEPEDSPAVSSWAAAWREADRAAGGAVAGVLRGRAATPAGPGAAAASGGDEPAGARAAAEAERPHGDGEVTGPGPAGAGLAAAAGRSQGDCELTGPGPAGARAAAEAEWSQGDCEMTGPGLAAQVLAAVPSGTTLFLGSSQSPRDLALAGAARDGVTVAANRGVAGIDGLVSTAVGMALAAPGPVVALLGDLSLLHDSTGLIIGPSEPRPDLTIVVGNNDGGGIFHTLESGAPAVADRFERVFGAPTGVDLERIVTGAGWRHVLATSAADLDRVLAENIGRGTVVIEVPIRRTDLRDLHARMRDAAVASLGETSPS